MRCPQITLPPLEAQHNRECLPVFFQSFLTESLANYDDVVFKLIEPYRFLIIRLLTRRGRRDHDGFKAHQFVTLKLKYRDYDRAHLTSLTDVL